MTELPFSKRKQTRRRQEYDGPEADLQRQLDDMLYQLGIWYIRLHAGVFDRLPPSLRRHYAGIPDTLAMIPISDKYMLCCPVELKRKGGKLHGKQKNWKQQGIAYQVSRSPEQSIAIVQQFQVDAEALREQVR